MSPSGKATDSDSVIRRFESYYPCQVIEKMDVLRNVHFFAFSFPFPSRRLLSFPDTA